MGSIMKKAVSLILALVFFVSFASCDLPSSEPEQTHTAEAAVPQSDLSFGEFRLADVPEYSGSPYAVINTNDPFFTQDDMTTRPFEAYSALDALGRCGSAYANVCREIMPTEKRGDISSVKPSGWQHVEYDFVDGRSLYNRCHLIAHSLAGEDANEKNLITGTRYMNADGMVPFENMVGDYVKETGNHVLYRVTPYFEGDDLIAKGVLMEAYSVEDAGEGVRYCVFCYNLQPGVEIDYSNGRSRVAEAEGSYSFSINEVVGDYVLNTRTKKFHYPDCKNVSEISAAAREDRHCRRGDLVEEGYVPCGGCKP